MQDFDYDFILASGCPGDCLWILNRYSGFFTIMNLNNLMKFVRTGEEWPEDQMRCWSGSQSGSRVSELGSWNLRKKIYAAIVYQVRCIRLQVAALFSADVWDLWLLLFFSFYFTYKDGQAVSKTALCIKIVLLYHCRRSTSSVSSCCGTSSTHVYSNLARWQHCRGLRAASGDPISYLRANEMN